MAGGPCSPIPLMCDPRCMVMPTPVEHLPRGTQCARSRQDREALRVLAHLKTARLEWPLWEQGALPEAGPTSWAHLLLSPFHALVVPTCPYVSEPTESC